jgi:uncharacterized protein VirK/YbjX
MSATANLAIGFEHVAKSGSARPTYIIAQERPPLPPTRLFIWAWRALVHLRSTHGVLRLIATVPPYSELLQSNPRFAFKFLTDDYLARGFSIPESAACFLHHYRRLRQILPNSLLHDILGEEVTILQFSECDDRIALTLGLSRPYDHEGELTLRLRVDGEIVFVLAFTLVPGRVVGSELAEAFLITRLQGIRGCYSKIARATRAMREVAPGRLLLHALQGVAEAFGIGAIAAVCGDRQTSYKEDCALEFREAYDNTFTDLGLTRNGGGFFFSTVPIPQKPLASVKRSHRARTAKKRAFKRQVQLACAAYFHQMGVHPTQVSSREEPLQLPQQMVSATGSAN